LNLVRYRAESGQGMDRGNHVPELSQLPKFAEYLAIVLRIPLVAPDDGCPQYARRRVLFQIEQIPPVLSETEAVGQMLIGPGITVLEKFQVCGVVMPS